MTGDDQRAVLVRVKSLLDDPVHAGKTDQESADLLNEPRRATIHTDEVLDAQGKVMTPASDQVKIVGPPPYVDTIIGVPFAPNAISAADIAAAKGL